MYRVCKGMWLSILFKRRYKRETICTCLDYHELHVCCTHAISPTLESYAVHSVLFTFPILCSKKLFRPTGLSLYGSRNMKIIQFTAVETSTKSQRRLWPNYKLTSASINSSSDSLNSFSNTVSDKNSWDTSTQRCFFCFWPVSSSSQYCLSQLTHQILHTNIGRARRQQSIPTSLTETVFLKVCYASGFRFSETLSTQQ